MSIADNKVYFVYDKEVPSSVCEDELRWSPDFYKEVENFIYIARKTNNKKFIKHFAGKYFSISNFLPPIEEEFPELDSFGDGVGGGQVTDANS